MSSTKNMPAKQAYRIDEVCTAYGLGRTKVYELINSGELPSVRVGRRRLVLRTGLDALLRNSQSGAV